jgi:hypothetical protein
MWGDWGATSVPVQWGARENNRAVEPTEVNWTEASWRRNSRRFKVYSNWFCRDKRFLGEAGNKSTDADTTIISYSVPLIATTTSYAFVAASSSTIERIDRVRARSTKSDDYACPPLPDTADAINLGNPQGQLPTRICLVVRPAAIFRTVRNKVRLQF